MKRTCLTMLMVLAATCSQLAGAAGLLTPKNSAMSSPEIRQHHVAVVIEDGYAITTVDQVFYNPNPDAIEAVYAFPVPAKAAVGEFTYWIDGNPVTGEVVRKEKAREIYAAEKSQGREVAITEKNEYKTFDSAVYPVRGQQDVRIRLVYIQPVHVDSAIGRYVYPLEDGGVDEDQMAFWSYNERVTEAFSFNLTLRSSYPLDDVRLPSHGNASATRVSDQEWKITITNGSVGAHEEEESSVAVATQAVQKLDKDIVVYWRLAQGLPGGVDLVTYRDPAASRGTFMLTLTPGDDLSSLSQGRDWTFVLDFSGSMKGKYHSLIEGVREGLGRLRPEDRFRIILFNNSSEEITGGFVPVNQEQVSSFMHKLDSMQPNGGTNLYAGLSEGISSLDADRPSAIILVTDGVANVGVTEKKQFLQLLEHNDIRLFTFVMGNSANRPLLEGMTKVSQGFSMNVSNSDDILGNVILASNKLSHEAMRDISINVKGVKTEDMTPSDIGSLYRGQQLIVFGHYRGDGEARLKVEGKVGAEDRSYDATLTFPVSDTRNPEIERLWAYAMIEDMQNRMDFLGADADTQDAIIDVATDHGLVTDYTSLIVVRDELFDQYQVKQANKVRVDREAGARQQRASAPVASHSQTSGSKLSQSRAYPKSGGSGGGAVGPWMIVLLLPLMFVLARRKDQVQARF